MRILLLLSTFIYSKVTSSTSLYVSSRLIYFLEAIDEAYLQGYGKTHRQDDGAYCWAEKNVEELNEVFKEPSYAGRVDEGEEKDEDEDEESGPKESSGCNVASTRKVVCPPWRPERFIYDCICTLFRFTCNYYNFSS